MTLKYHWEHQKITHPQGYFYKQSFEDVEYEIEITPTKRDIVDYLMPINLSKSNKHKTQKEISETQTAAYYMEKMFEFLEENNAIDLDRLEEDEYFVEFMHERYQVKALEEWEEMSDE